MVSKERNEWRPAQLLLIARLRLLPLFRPEFGADKLIPDGALGVAASMCTPYLCCPSAWSM